MTTLTVCALANKSTQDLERFFTCLGKSADQVLIGNLSGSDKISKKCEEKNAQVLSFLNTKDFAAARNTLLDHATSEWVLILDTHESISNPDLVRVKNFIDHTFAFFLHQALFYNQSCHRLS